MLGGARLLISETRLYAQARQERSAHVNADHSRFDVLSSFPCTAPRQAPLLHSPLLRNTALAIEPCLPSCTPHRPTVNSPHASYFKVLRGTNMVTCHPGIRPQRNPCSSPSGWVHPPNAAALPRSRYHTQDYEPFTKSQLVYTQLTLRSYFLQTWSRCPRISGGMNPS